MTGYESVSLVRWLFVDGSVKQAKDLRLPLTFRSKIYLQQGKNRARGPYRKKAEAGPVTIVWLANQIRAFRNPACSDAWEESKFYV